MAKQSVLVKVPKDHPFPYYRRAGLALQPGDNVVEVEPKQLAALKADAKLLVGPVPPPEKPEGDKKPEGGQPQGAGDKR